MQGLSLAIGLMLRGSIGGAASNFLWPLGVWNDALTWDDGKVWNDA